MVILEKRRNPKKAPKRFRNYAKYVSIIDDEYFMYDIYYGDYIYRTKTRYNELTYILDDGYKEYRKTLVDEYNTKHKLI